MHILMCLRLPVVGTPVQDLKDMVHQQSHKLKGNIRVLCYSHKQEHQHFLPVCSLQVMDTLHKVAMGPLQASFQITMETTSGQELIQINFHPPVIEIPVEHQVLIVLNIHSFLNMLAAQALAHLHIRVTHLQSSSENVAGKSMNHKKCLLHFVESKHLDHGTGQKTKQNKQKTHSKPTKLNFLATSPYSISVQVLSSLTVVGCKVFRV